jgi:hypothetical protein
LDEDPGASLWSCWPLWQQVEGGGTSLNIRWPQAGAMRSAIAGLARSASVIFYDPLSEVLIIPGSCRW